MEENVKTLNDYLHMAVRRRYLIVGLILPFSVLSVIVALILPPVYHSEATILIEQQQIPTELVKSTVTSYAIERIQLIKQTIMTVNNLMKIIDKYNLYPKQRTEFTEGELANEFRENTSLDLVKAEVVDNKGKRIKATIAFKLGFNSKSAKTSQEIVKELVALYLDENTRTRTVRAKETTLFLENEATKLKAETKIIEDQITEYKQKYSNSLPELLQVNLKAVDRTEGELSRLEFRERMIHERKISLSSQMTLVSPNVSTSFANPITIESLKAEQASLLSKYSSGHPDVQRINRQIEQLELTMYGAQGNGSPLQLAEIELGALQKKYSDDHPDVKALKRRITSLEKQGGGNVSAAPGQMEITNPAFMKLSNELQIAEVELAHIRTQRARLQAKLSELEHRISQTYQVERGYTELVRDLDSHRAKYKDLKAKQLHAMLSENLESEQKAEHFLLLEPAYLPQKPDKPNRLKILVMGVLVSIGAGLGAALLIETLDSSIRNHRELTYITGIAPMVVIPYIEIQEDLDQTKKYKTWFTLLCVGSFIGLIFAIHFLYKPIEIIWIEVWDSLAVL